MLFFAVALPETAVANSPRDILSAHDPYDRLSNTSIRSFAELSVQGTRFAIYCLTFVNPVSRHGQHRIAVSRCICSDSAYRPDRRQGAGREGNEYLGGNELQFPLRRHRYIGCFSFDVAFPQTATNR